MASDKLIVVWDEFIIDEIKDVPEKGKKITGMDVSLVETSEPTNRWVCPEDDDSGIYEVPRDMPRGFVYMLYDNTTGEALIDPEDKYIEYVVATEDESKDDDYKNKWKKVK